MKKKILTFISLSHHSSDNFGSLFSVIGLMRKDEDLINALFLGSVISIKSSSIGETESATVPLHVTK
jgi:hypothetical protein